MATNNANCSLAHEIAEQATQAQEITVAGQGSSRRHNLKDQLAVLNALGSASAGPRAGIRRVRLVTGSPTGMRFNIRGDEFCR